MRNFVNKLVENSYWKLFYEVWMCIVGLAIIIGIIRHYPVI